MSKHFFNSKQIYNTFLILIIILVAYSVNRIANFVITERYRNFIDTKGLIEAFDSGDPFALRQLQEQYHFEYEVIKEGKIIQKTIHWLPDVNPIIIETKPNPDVLSYDLRSLLKQIRPNIVVNTSGLFVVFPLVFENKTDQYIVFHQLIP